MIKQYGDGIANQHIEDPLLFWKENKTKYPKLSKLAKRFLCVPTSEADVERILVDLYLIQNIVVLVKIIIKI